MITFGLEIFKHLSGWNNSGFTCDTKTMKRRAIYFLLLVCLFFFRGGVQACICPEVATERISTKSVAVIASTSDLCADCGHTKNCCFKNQDLDVAGVDIKCADAQLTLLATLLISQCSDLVPRDPIYSCSLSRAPPWVLHQTPIVLHQKLVV